MASKNENQAETPKVTPPLGRTPSESHRVRKEQQGAVQFCARLGRTPTETHELLNSAYQQDSLRKPVTKTYHNRFQTLGVDVYKSDKKGKKAKNTGDRKIKSEENGGDDKADNDKQENMNVEQNEEENNVSNNGEGEHQTQSESDPKEVNNDSSEKCEESSDSTQVNKTTEKGSTDKVEGSTES